MFVFGVLHFLFPVLVLLLPTMAFAALGLRFQLSDTYSMLLASIGCVYGILAMRTYEQYRNIYFTCPVTVINDIIAVKTGIRRSREHFLILSKTPVLTDIEKQQLLDEEHKEMSYEIQAGSGTE